MTDSTRTFIIPNDRAAWLNERRADVTSTEVSALFGLSKYMTAYELAMLKAGKIDDTFTATERTDWGTRLQDSIAAGVASRFGVSVRPKSEYIRRRDVRMGASFDYEITGVVDSMECDDQRLREAFGMYGAGILEIKNVDAWVFKNEWMIGEAPEAPAHIEIQLQCQLDVSGLDWGCIACLVGGNRLELILRLRDHRVGDSLRAKVAKFWTDLDAGIYPPVTLPEDADVIKQMYNFAEPGKLLDARDDEKIAGLIAEYIAANADVKAATDRKTTAQAGLLQLIGDHERVLSSAGTISAGLVAPTWIEAYERKGYRNFRVTPKKESKK